MITVQIGKNGVTEGLLQHIKGLLQEHGAVKCNLLKSYADTVNIEETAEAFTKVYDDIEVESTYRGNTVTLHKK